MSHESHGTSYALKNFVLLNYDCARFGIISASHLPILNDMAFQCCLAQIKLSPLSDLLHLSFPLLHLVLAFLNYSVLNFVMDLCRGKGIVTSGASVVSSGEKFLCLCFYTLTSAEYDSLKLSIGFKRCLRRNKR